MVTIRCVGGRFDGINFNYPGPFARRLWVWQTISERVQASPTAAPPSMAAYAYAYAGPGATPTEMRYCPEPAKRARAKRNV